MVPNFLILPVDFNGVKLEVQIVTIITTAQKCEWDSIDEEDLKLFSFFFTGFCSNLIFSWIKASQGSFTFTFLMFQDTLTGYFLSEITN